VLKTNKHISSATTNFIRPISICYMFGET